MNQEVDDYLAYYKAQAGGEYSYFKGSRFQEGYGGLGGLYIQNGRGLGGMFKKFAMMMMTTILGLKKTNKQYRSGPKENIRVFLI